MRGLAGACWLGAVLALPSLVASETVDASSLEDDVTPYEEKCDYGISSVPHGCQFLPHLQCCPDYEPWSTFRRRQAMEPLLVQQVASLYPLGSKQGFSLNAAGFPPWITGPPFRMMIGVTIFRIFDIDQRSQTFSMHFRLRAMWRDCRLVNNCTWIQMPQTHPNYSHLWRPSFKIEEQENNEEGMDNELLYFSPDGAVSWLVERSGIFRCAFDFSELPFDSQNCSITLMMPFGDKTFVQPLHLPGPNGELVVVERQNDAEWEISESSAWKGESVDLVREVNNMYGEVRALRLTFKLKRRPRSMIINFVFPAVLFYLTSWLGLWIDASAVPARAAIGVVPVLIMTNKLGSLNSIVPPISYSVRLENFLLSTLTFIVMHMLEFGVVNYGLRQERALKFARERHEVQATPSSATIAAEFAEGHVLQATRDAGTRTLQFSDRMLTWVGGLTDMHMRWMSLVAYIATSLLLLLV